MSKTLASWPLLDQEITYSTAKEEENDILRRLTCPAEQKQLYDYISHNKGIIENLVSCTVGLSGRGKCQMSPHADWMRGSFNELLIDYQYIYERACSTRIGLLPRFAVQGRGSAVRGKGSAVRGESLRASASFARRLASSA